MEKEKLNRIKTFIAENPVYTCFEGVSESDWAYIYKYNGDFSSIDVYCPYCKENKTLSIAIIGDGPLLLEIKESIAAKKLDKNIKCLGFVENPLKILAQAKLLILTSNWEGTPICVLEAMALGVPVVSTPTDGIVELIQNDISGFTSWDNVLLAKKINEYVLDENKREKLSQNIINKFNEINNIQEYKHQLLHYYLN